MTWQVSCGHFWSYCIEIRSHMSKAKRSASNGAQLVPIGIPITRLKRRPPNCTKMLSRKNSIILQMLSAVYMLSPLPFIS